MLALALSSLLSGCAVVLLSGMGGDGGGSDGTSAGPHGGIERVVLAQGYGSGYGGMVTVEFRPAVLYRDGTYSADSATALTEAAVLAGRWSEEGDGWRLEPDGEEPVDVPASMAARPAVGGATLEGVYRNIGGVGAPGTGVPVVVAWSEVEFSGDGTLRAAQGGGVDAGDVGAGGQSSATGRYTLDGWTATVEYDDGRTETGLFYLYPDSDGAIGFLGRTLSRRE